jgi:hypothetical protein
MGKMRPLRRATASSKAVGYDSACALRSSCSCLPAAAPPSPRMAEPARKNLGLVFGGEGATLLAAPRAGSP